MTTNFLQNSKRGFIAIPVAIFIFSTVVVGGTIGITKIVEIDKKIKERETQLLAELGQLYQIKKADRSLKEKVGKYQDLGVEVPQIATDVAKLRQLILAKNFFQSKIFLSQLDKKLEESLTEKKEAERKVALQARNNLEAKLVDFKKKGVNVAEVDAKLPEIRSLIDKQDYTQARESISTLSQRLDKLLAAKLEEERKAEEAKKAAAVKTAPVSQSIPGITYERKTVATSRGNFTVDVLTVNLAQIQVVTDTANSDDCDNNCPTKPLAQFVAERGGVAGIHGTYFCPPDYAQCAGKVASFDFPVYNTILGKFINSKTLFWSGRAMIAVDSAGRLHFFREAKNFGGVNLRAAIVNYPALVDNGQIVVDESLLAPALGQTKGNRGALGFSGNTLFGVISRSATVGDMAYIMAALGAKYAMNLDGGGSSAMFFNNGYKVGPGRNLPNAVIFVR